MQSAGGGPEERPGVAEGIEVEMKHVPGMATGKKSKGKAGGRGGASAGSGTKSTSKHASGSCSPGAVKLKQPKGGGFDKCYGNYDK